MRLTDIELTDLWSPAGGGRGALAPRLLFLPKFSDSLRPALLCALTEHMRTHAHPRTTGSKAGPALSVWTAPPAPDPGALTG